MIVLVGPSLAVLFFALFVLLRPHLRRLRARQRARKSVIDPTEAGRLQGLSRISGRRL